MLWWVVVVGCKQDPTDTGTVTTPGSETSDTGATTTVPITTPTIGGFALTVDAKMVLLVRAAFDDPGGTDAWVEYRFEGGDWLIAPTTAPGVAAILGLPAQTEVEARAAAVVDGVTRYSASAFATTGVLPPGLLVPQVLHYDPTLASPEPYAMISVATGSFTYSGPYYVEIFDRDGRVVWYHQVPDGLFCDYPHASLDGTHLWFEGENIFGFASGTPGVTRQTLDGRWVQFWPIPNLGEAISEGPDQTFFYEQRSGSTHGLAQLDPYGDSTTIWDCSAYFSSLGLSTGTCVMNTCEWDAARGTVLASQFETSTVFEIDVATGTPIRQMGQLSVGDPYTFVPATSEFAYQHDPHWTSAGTLLVSTHLPCGGQSGCNDNSGRDGTQVAAQYVVDDVAKTITRVSAYVSTDRWATQMGEATLLPNGNLIQGYGQDGAVREVTPDGQTAWEAAWAKDNSGYRVVGHFSLVADLYALNQGP